MEIKKSALILIVCMIIFFARGVYLINYYSVTEEAVYIANGYTLYHTGDFIISATHPQLLHLLVSAPLLITRPNIELYPPEYREKYYDIQWVYSDRFVFFSGNDADSLMAMTRIPVLLLSLVLMVYVFLWSKELFGKTAAIIATLLFTFEPNIIGYSALLMDDMPVAVFIFISAYYLWKSLNANTIKNWILFGIFTGCALSTKFSSAVIIPIYLIILFITIKKGSYKHYKKNLLISLGMLLLVINASYFFQGFLGPIGQEQYPNSPLKFLNSPVLSWIPSPVPKYFLVGLDMAYGMSGVSREDTTKTYLLGKYRENADTWYFHILTILLKTPLALLLLFLFVLVSLLTKKISIDKKVLALSISIPVITVFFFSIGQYKLGVRHILIVYPFMILITCAIFSCAHHKKQFWKYMIFGLLIWYVASSIVIHPDYLSYFNEAAGGPNNADKYFIESNIDLGQNLKALKTWMDDNHIQGIYLSHYGHDFPNYRKINYTIPPCGKLMPGWTAVSLNHIHGYMFTGQPLDCYTFLQNITPTKKIGYSLYLYYVPEKQGI